MPRLLLSKINRIWKKPSREYRRSKLRWTMAKRTSAERNWFRLSGRRKIRSDSLVLEEGIEPTRPCGHRILSPARLPVPPLELQKARPSRLACGDAYAQGA